MSEDEFEFELIKIPFWLTKNGGCVLKTKDGDLELEEWDVVSKSKTHVKVNGKKYRLMDQDL
ncbi:MAG: hypothetical protein AB7O96_00965 [Pseudobdellovibrionaceae bacterium]